MQEFIDQLARKLRPELEGMNGQQRMSATADVLTLLYSFPLMIIGLVWLVEVSNWESVRQKWMLYLLMAVTIIVFNRVRFFFITEIRTGGYANSDGAIDGLVVWAAILLLGPTALWLRVIWNFFIYSGSLIRRNTSESFWNHGRMITTDIASDLIPTLVALVVYKWVGGVIPIKDYSILSITPAFFAIIIQYILTALIFSGYIAFVVWSLKNILHAPARPAIGFFVMALTLPALANPFGIVAAGMYAREGLWVFLYLIIGLLLVAILARQLSQAAEYSRQQYSQIEQLELLGRTILEGPPDGSNLSTALNKHVLSMFASPMIFIWTEAKGVLMQEPGTPKYDWEPAWRWLQANPEAISSMPGKGLPWDPAKSLPGPAILCPIRGVENDQLIGLIFIELQTLAIPWNTSAIRRQLPGVQSLAAQIASAIYQTHVYADNLAVQKTMQELSLARTIQSSFLPESIPQLAGWQLTAALEPARQVAGDFYDFIRLPDGNLGFLIADVADKGLGSALYMALSSTLLRTFANDYSDSPALVLKNANQHILRHARANLFVTVFYGILNPTNGLLRYANGGHTPPYLMNMDGEVKTLSNTGMPLGIDMENEWGQDEVTISPGEMLLLYTDGVLDAQNSEGDFIDRAVILNTAQQNICKTVQDVQQGILDEVHHFVGEAPRFDDLTLVILRRDS